MRKILGIFVVILLFVFTAIICVNFLKSPAMYVSDKQEIENDGSVEFNIIKSSKAAITYEIVNNKDEDITYNSYYWIEKNIDGVWFKYQIQVDFVDEVYTLRKGEKTQEDVVIGNIYNLDSGRYRIIKYIGSELYACEFNIY